MFYNLVATKLCIKSAKCVLLWTLISSFYLFACLPHIKGGDVVYANTAHEIILFPIKSPLWGPAFILMVGDEKTERGEKIITSIFLIHLCLIINKN